MTSPLPPWKGTFERFLPRKFIRHEQLWSRYYNVHQQTLSTEMCCQSQPKVLCVALKQILWLVWYTKAVSSLTLLIVVVEDWQRQVVVCSQVFINSVLGWLDVLGLEKAVVILTYTVLDIEPGWNKFCFQSSSCVWMISRLNQDSLKTVLCFSK